jgi:hypothetical protein
MQIKNIKHLRENLVTNYEKMVANELPLGLGKELANTAGKILNSCKIELEYNQYQNNEKKIDFLESE